MGYWALTALISLWYVRKRQ
ncbi:MAG: GlyGly-CTERM sorting domain-containing protein [Gammaproteobacteria bacterium]|nr:GlyGly-CTERM sorting domain-containing protein [Gammaproteobacteria bacterium]